MPKQLNQVDVNLSFNADTSKAKKEIADLQKSLQDIAKMPGSAGSLFNDTEIKNASKAALELQRHLNAAVNVNTGKLDLSRFSTSLKAAGKDLDGYYNQLIKIGPKGQDTFMQLARSISTAEAPVTRLNAKMAEFVVTLKNSARWQISSSVIHGFMGSIQSAYGYAKDLNESLNNIRIVTGQSTDQMAKFASEANKAAKSLSTTTTAYTDAALIFYQQGLTGKDVTDRTNTVIKMANVTKDSEEQVSSYMTAIWNNYAKGSDNLEHYADVITALGAATASSSAEIAAGLEKFASIGETVGLSYEYATSALATVVATTRQSEDVVGTAFKTIFSRLQGLTLGETLEDGVDLNKYSKALNAVGVAVLDTSGNMRQLDDILDDMAGKWDILSNAQQTALAQTVAGTRQYTQLMALMNNWDFMQRNVEVAKDSEGSLQAQADIYAESWEAANKRVKAAMHELYSDIINDDFFIDLANSVEKVVGLIDDLIKGFGGVKGVLATFGGLFLSLYANKIPEAFNNLKQNLMVISGQAKKVMTDIQSKTGEQLNEIQNDNSLSASYKAKAEGMAKVNAMQLKLTQSAKNLTQEEYNDYKAKIQLVESIYEEIAAMQKEEEALEKRSNSLVNNFSRDVKASANKAQYGNEDDEDAMLARLEMRETANTLGLKMKNYDEDNATNYLKLAKDITLEIEKQVAAYRKENNELSKLESLENEYISQKRNWDDNKNAGAGSEEAKTMASQMSDILRKAIETGIVEETDAGIEAFKRLASSGQASAQQLLDGFNKLGINEDAFSKKIFTLQQNLEKFRTTMREIGVPQSTLNDFEKLEEEIARLKGEIADSKVNTDTAFGDPKHIQKMSQTISQFGGTVMTTVGFVNSLKNTFESFNDENADFSTIMGSLTSTLMSGGMAFSQLSSAAASAGIGLAAASGVVLGIVAALGLLAFGIKEIIAAQPGAKLKRLSEASKNLSQNLEDVKNKADALKSTFDEYDTIVDKLNNCTKGTQDWYDTLDEVENKISDIIEEFPELLENENLFNSDGTFNKNEINNIISQNDSAITNARYANMLGKADVLEKQTEIDFNKIYNKDLSKVLYNYDEETFSRVVSGLNDIKSEDAFKDRVEDLFKEFNLESEELDNLKNSLWESRDAINEYAESVDRTSRTYNNAVKIAASEKLSDYDDATKELALKGQEEYYKQEKDKLEEEFNKINRFNSADNSRVKELWDEFNKANNTDYKLASNAVRGGDNNRSFAYIDSETREEKQVTAEEMMATIAASRALEELGVNAREASQTIKNIDNNAGEFAEGLKNYITNGNLDSLTQAQAEVLGSKITDKDSADKYLQEITGKNSEELSSLLGNNYAEDFLFKVEDINTAFNSVFSNLLSDVRSAISDLGLDSKDLSLETKKSIGNFLEQALVSGGADGLEKAKDIFAKNGTEFQKVIAGISDWSTMDVNQLISIIDDAGISANMTADDWADLVDTMKSQVMQSVETLTEKFKKLHSIVDNIQLGDAIDKEAYDSLTPAAQSYFTMMMDGTYMLTGSAKELYNLVNTESKRGFQENIALTQEKIEQLKNFNGYNTDVTQTASRGNNSAIQNQFDALRLFTDTGEEQILKWQDALKEGDYTRQNEVLHEMSQALEGVDTSSEGVIQKTLELKDAIYEQQGAIAMASSSYNELNGYLSQGMIDQYQYNNALVSVTQTQAKMHDLDFDDIVDQGAALAEQYELTEAAGRALAVENQRMNRGIETLSKSIEDWKKNLLTTDKTSLRYINTVQDMSKAIADLVGANEDLKLSGKFIEENLSDIEKASKGSEEAINKLGVAVSKESVKNMSIKKGSSDNYNFSKQYIEFEKNKEIVLKGITELENKINSLEVGTPFADIFDGLDIGMGEWETALNQMAKATKMSVDEMNSLLNSMGIQAEVSTTKVPQQIEVPIYETIEKVEKIDSGGGKDQKPATWKKTSYTRQNGTKKVLGWVDVAQVNMGDSAGTAPTIVKNASPAPTSGGSGGGGGGGSSTGGSNKDLPENDIDPYHDVNRKINRITNSIKKLDTAQEHLAGNNLSKSLKKQAALLKQQGKNFKEYGKVVEQELKKYKGKLAEFGAEYKKNGELKNYTPMYNTEFQKFYNATIAYNSSKKTDADEEAYKQAEKRYSKFKELISKYDETLDKQMDNEQKKLENLYAIAEKYFKAFKVKIEYKLELADAKKSWNDFLKETATTSPWATYENVMGNMRRDLKEMTILSKNYFKVNENGITTILKDIKKLQKGKKVDRFATLDDAKAALREQFEELTNNASDAYAVLQDAINQYMEGISQVAEKWDKLLDRFTKLNDQLEKYKEIFSVIYGDKSKKTLEANKVFNQGQQKVLFGQLDTEKTRLASDEAYLANIVKNGGKAGDKDYDEILDRINETKEKILDISGDIIKNAKDDALNTIELIFFDINKKFKDFNEKWDLTGKIYEDYYDSFQKITALENLENEKRKMFENSSLKNNVKLQAQADKMLKTLREKEKLTKHDIEIAQKRLAVMQAEIELEEARNRKDTIKRVRDSEGNWTYQYVANQSDIEEKRNNLLQKANDVRDADLKENERVTKSLQEWREGTKTKLQEIWSDNNLSTEEKRAQSQKLIADRGIVDKQLSEQLNTSLTYTDEDTITLAKAQITAGDTAELEKTPEGKALAEGIKKGLSEEELMKLARAANTSTVGQYSNIFEVAGISADAFMKQMSDMANAGEKAYLDFDKTREEVEKKSGLTLSDTSKIISDVNTSLKDIQETIPKIVEESDGLDVLRTQAQKAQTEWNKLLKEMIKVENNTLKIDMRDNEKKIKENQKEINEDNAKIKKKQKELKKTKNPKKRAKIESEISKLKTDKNKKLEKKKSLQNKSGKLYKQYIENNNEKKVADMTKIGENIDESVKTKNLITSDKLKMLADKANSKGMKKTSEKIVNIQANFPNAANAEQIQKAFNSLPTIAKQWLMESKL